MRSIFLGLACVIVVGCGSDSGHSGSDGGPDSGCARGDECAEAGAAGAGESGASGAGPDAGCAPGDDCAQGGAPDGGSVPSASLRISPSGTNGKVQISEPTEFSAVLVNGSGAITWSLTGGGTLSATTGTKVLFSPPLGTATETLTATAADATASVEIESSPPAITGATIPSLSAPVTVQYDAEDIPHIRCKTTADCLAAQGYVQAQDRLFPMDYLRHSARSTLAELIGASGLEQDVQLRTLFITRAGHRVEEDLASAMSAPTKALVTAFVSGINAYLAVLRAHPEKLPGEYAQLPFQVTPAEIPDWTLQDTLAIMRLQQFQLSETISTESAFAQFAAVYGPGAPLVDLGKLNGWVRAAAPSTEQAHTLSATPSAALVHTAQSSLPGELSSWLGVLAPMRAKFDSLRQQLRPAGAGVGSNNWVVSGAKSTTGAAMVANDPHIGLRYPPLFHLSALTSTTVSDRLNLSGGTFPGLPGALVGRGARVGWGVTVVGYDVTDLYQEQFLPQASCPSQAPCVLFKGAPTATIPIPQTFLVRVGPGASGLVDVSALGLSSPPPAVTLIIPQHGPVIQAPDSTGRAISVRWTGQEGNTQDLTAIIGLNTALDVDAAVIALTDFSTGAQNFVLADDQGHIAFDPHALVPVRRFADASVSGTNLIPPWFPLPGDGSAEWGDGSADCAAATSTRLPPSCWIANASLPHGKDPAKGYFFSSNADPIGVSDDNNPLAHPPYLSFDWDDSTGFRSKRIEERLEQALAKNGSVSLEDMVSIQSDHVSRPGMAFTEYVAALPTSAGDPAALVAAKAVLLQWAANGWDCPSGLLGTDPLTSPVDPAPAVAQSSSGCFFFHEFLRALLRNVFDDDLAVAGLGVDSLQAMKSIFLITIDSNTVDGAAAASFCNDVNASGAVTATHTCAAQVNLALIAAYGALTTAFGPPSEWVWGRVHTIQPVSLAPLVTTSYSPGPFARPGGAFTVDVGTPSLSGTVLDFSYTSGGNVRHISLMDPAAPLVKMQLPGPERDGPYPPPVAGADLIGQWVNNQYFDYAFGDQIEAAAASTQTFTAH